MTEKVYLGKDDFDKIKNDSIFVEISCLARVCNLLRFSMYGYLPNMDTQDLSQRKQLITNSFFIAASFLYEGFNVIDRLNEKFHDVTIFKNSLGILISDKFYKRFRKEILSKVRNKATFHSLGDTVSDVINRLNFEEYIFVSLNGKTSLDLYYELSDLIAINYIIGDNGSDKEDEKKLYEIVKTTSDIAIKFISSADEFIRYYLTESNWIFMKDNDKK